MPDILLLNQRNYKLDFTWLKPLEKILKKEFKLKQEISLSLLKSAEIKKLNQVYRHKNKVTDVLSFVLAENNILGEVLICVDQAKKQAKAKGHSLDQEIKILAIHGILHLLGYDHEISEAHYIKQTKMEEKILNKLSL